MNDSQLQQEIAIIKAMIERTRRETFVSGYLFIIPGILWIVGVLVLAMLEFIDTPHQLMRLSGFIAFSALIVSSAFISIREGRKERVKSYSKQLFGQLWGACGIAILIMAVLIPLLNVSRSAGLFVPLIIIGIGFYMTGVIYELPLVQVCGFVWWIGPCLFAFVTGPSRLILWISLILFGYVLPGILLNRQYRLKKGAEHGS